MCIYKSNLGYNGSVPSCISGSLCDRSKRGWSITYYKCICILGGKGSHDKYSMMNISMFLNTQYTSIKVSGSHNAQRFTPFTANVREALCLPSEKLSNS